jgi:muramidase (phage lysozyme)
VADYHRLQQELKIQLANPNVAAFLRVIRFCEGTADDNGYRRMFGGRLFDDLADHPRSAQTYTLRKGGKLTSTAAGAYQYLSRTWDGLVNQFGFTDFGRESQDLGAVALIKGRKALNDLLNGDLPTTVRKCALEWASLPGSPYGQPVKSYDEVLKQYLAHGGQLKAVQTAVTTHVNEKDSDMHPLLIPLVQTALLEGVPKLSKLFSSGSETGDRNVKVVEAVSEIAKTVVGAKNEQELVEIMSKDPDAVASVRQAVEDNWFQLEEIGGGVEAARKADLQVMANDGPWWQVLRSPSFIIGFFGLLPLVYLVVLSIIGVMGNAEWSQDVRAAIAGTIVGTIVGGLVGYYFGQTTSRNRTKS